jgi:hypothetical protein
LEDLCAAMTPLFSSGCVDACLGTADEAEVRPVLESCSLLDSEGWSDSDSETWSDSEDSDPPSLPVMVNFTVSSVTSFSALDIAAFDDATFSASFQATFISQLTSYAGAVADSTAEIVSIRSGSVQSQLAISSAEAGALASAFMQSSAFISRLAAYVGVAESDILSVMSGSVQVESHFVTSSSTAATTLASGLSSDASAVFTDASFASYGTITALNVTLSNSTTPSGPDLSVDLNNRNGIMRAAMSGDKTALTVALADSRQNVRPPPPHPFVVLTCD